MVPKVTGNCDLNHTVNENCAILFSSIQSTHSFNDFDWLCFLQCRLGISARSTAREETWPSTTTALTPHDAQVRFAVRKVNLRSQQWSRP
jgi:hypothetical protein